MRTEAGAGGREESVVFMTAYVVSGFGQAHSAGYDLDAESLRMPRIGCAKRSTAIPT